MPDDEQRKERLSKALDKIEQDYSKAEDELAALQKRVKELREALDENSFSRKPKPQGEK